ncbi:MAG: type VI secretion system tip protein VgrG [Myxococcales bacterium]|nr:type VI secretion system tip protein VgrG [Myxococcales bacterium]
MTSLVTFHSHSLRGSAQVVRFDGTETINELYAFDVQMLVARDDAVGFAQRAIGEPAVLTMHDAAGAARDIRGIIGSGKAHGTFDADRAIVTVRIVPRLFRLTLRKASRVFVDRSAREVVAEVLARGRVPHRFSLASEPSRREMCVQYAETDFDFVRRLMAEEGMFFFFDHAAEADGGTPQEELVVGDEPQAYPPLRHAPELRYARGAGGDVSTRHDEIRDFVATSRMRPHAVLLRSFDFARPNLELGTARALAGSPSLVRRADLRAFVDNDLTVSEHLGSRECLADTGDAARVLEAARQGASDASASSANRRLAPGHTFRLAGHDLGELDGDYVITRVDHTGYGAGFAPDGASFYDNHFTCVPASLAVRPPRPQPRVVQAWETATVVGPPGQPVFTDDHGRVKLRFHWDLREAPEEPSSCWARVAQSWAGAGWGAQFLPRVGAEVVVGFLAGDPDRPIVVGGVYNGVRPLPFGQGARDNVSGIRSQSLENGAAGHEIAWDDTPGQQVLALRARGRMVQEVENDLRIDASGSTTFRTAANRADIVGGDWSTQVTGEASAAIGGRQSTSIGADHELLIAGARKEEVGGDRIDLVGGAVLERIAGPRTTFVGAGGGAHGSDVLSVAGQYRVASGAGMVLASQERLLLRVGSSSITLEPTRILIESEEVLVQALKKVSLAQGEEAVASSLVLSGSACIAGGEVIASSGAGAVLHLDADAKLDGALVKLNCGPGKGSGAKLVRSESTPGTATVRLDPRFLEGSGPYTVVLQLPDGTVKEFPIEPGGEVTVDGNDGDQFIVVEVRQGDRPVAVRKEES